ncbi:hypothetical protein [Mycolicibacterium sediminis]|uniref:Uncharacterized protein n=1 Tax=Mycolicibacterium sediminis TaxID=1286180 RepID=A0A7I7QI21_9MYCO|nr:hypothetical protein [Mycolicibacterium sediminis]BBY25921.1 hypothetical protein MSEDJ_00170 [Mycolicibacterium sediminis]
MTARTNRILFTLLSGSALVMAPLAFSTVVTPAIGSADDCAGVQPCGGNGSAASQSVSCTDGQIVDAENGRCVSLLDGISKQLQALPPPPSLAGLGTPDGLGGISGLPLGEVNPTLALPSVGLQVVPNLQLTPDLGVGTLLGGAAALSQLPGPQLPPPPAINPLNPLGLPPPPAINPLNPLGLPPPPDLTPGIPFI